MKGLIPLLCLLNGRGSYYVNLVIVATFYKNYRPTYAQPSSWRNHKEYKFTQVKKKKIPGLPFL